MQARRIRWRTFKRQDRAAAVAEFALVVPILFFLVWGAMNFSRAYQRLNVLTGALREGARLASTQPVIDQGPIRARIVAYSTAFGFPLNGALVTTTLAGTAPNQEVRTSVTNYPLFSNLTGFGALNSITVSRTAIFRWEYAN